MGKLSFGTTGYSYTPGEVKLKVGGSPQCSRCQGRVYFNEQKRALGKVWHTRCFNCAKCKKSLDSTNCAGHQDEIYCTPCHKKMFGPRGYGFAGGAAGLSTESTTAHPQQTEAPTTTTVPSNIPATSSSGPVDPSRPDSCPRCGKRVFFAEETKALKRKWHRLCFKCAECNKLLEPGRCSEHEGEVYCSTCYGRHFGPSGYGYAGGAGCLLSSEPDRPDNAANYRVSPRNSTSTHPIMTEDGVAVVERSSQESQRMYSHPHDRQKYDGEVYTDDHSSGMLYSEGARPKLNGYGTGSGINGFQHEPHSESSYYGLNDYERRSDTSPRNSTYAPVNGYGEDGLSPRSSLLLQTRLNALENDSGIDLQISPRVDSGVEADGGSPQTSPGSASKYDTYPMFDTSMPSRQQTNYTETHTSPLAQKKNNTRAIIKGSRSEEFTESIPVPRIDAKKKFTPLKATNGGQVDRYGKGVQRSPVAKAINDLMDTSVDGNESHSGSDDGIVASRQRVVVPSPKNETVPYLYDQMYSQTNGYNNYSSLPMPARYNPQYSKDSRVGAQQPYQTLTDDFKQMNTKDTSTYNGQWRSGMDDQSLLKEESLNFHNHRRVVSEPDRLATGRPAKTTVVRQGYDDGDFIRRIQRPMLSENARRLITQEIARATCNTNNSNAAQSYHGSASRQPVPGSKEWTDAVYV